MRSPLPAPQYIFYGNGNWVAGIKGNSVKGRQTGINCVHFASDNAKVRRCGAGVEAWIAAGLPLLRGHCDRRSSVARPCTSLSLPSVRAGVEAWLPPVSHANNTSLCFVGCREAISSMKASHWRSLIRIVIPPFFTCVPACLCHAQVEYELPGLMVKGESPPGLRRFPAA